MSALRLPPTLPGWPVALLGLLPLAWPFLSNALDFQIDPARAWVHQTGNTATWLLVATLCMTPLQRWTGWAGWIRWRRVLGLLTFTYVTLHLLAFTGLWQEFDIARLVRETGKRPYLWVGLSAWLLLLPLALTSTRAAQRRLGRRWKTLHQLVYVIAGLAVWHQAWAHKIGLMGVWPAAAALTILLLWRLRGRFSRKKTAVGREV